MMTSRSPEAELHMTPEEISSTCSPRPISYQEAIYWGGGTRLNQPLDNTCLEIRAPRWIICFDKLGAQATRQAVPPCAPR